MTQHIQAEVFRDVDATAAAEAAAAYLDRVAASPAARAYKEATLARLDLTPGMSVADVGCGAGTDLPGLSRLVGPDGQVVGVDLSVALVETADARTAALGNVSTRVADAHALPFEDGQFDAARVDRVLLHVERPDAVVRELARIVRPGGRVVASEGDWGTLVVAPEGGDAARRAFDPLAAGVRHPFIGRHLGDVMVTAGLDVLSVEPVTAVLRSLNEAVALLQLGAMWDGAVARGEVDAPERDRWLASAQAATDRGAFLASLTGFITVGAVV